MTFHAILFLLSGLLLLWSANWLVGSVTHIARYLRWKEFVIAFFVMAIVSSLPNLFVGITSALQGIPELSFGDIVGNSVVDLTLVVALAVLVARKLETDSPLIQKSALFTLAIAILPLLLILDKELSRGDGIALLLAFAFYSIWLLSKRKEYVTPFNHPNDPKVQDHFSHFRLFLQSIGKIVIGILLLLVSAQGVVAASLFFAREFQVPLAMVGIIVLGLGSALPETYFTIAAARRGNSKIILGDLMGTVIVMATLVLGIVALITPIHVPHFSSFAIARFFLFASALFFFVFLRSGKKISKKEAIFLILLYVAFILAEIFHNGRLP
jgi:cation:H+ antiporter